jgi:hypothetical protein
MRTKKIKAADFILSLHTNHKDVGWKFQGGIKNEN